MIRRVILFECKDKTPDMAVFEWDDIDEIFEQIKQSMKENNYRKIDKIIVKDYDFNS